LGENDPNETEEQQSSAQITQGTDPDIQTDPAAGVAPPDSADEAALAASTPATPMPPAENPRTLRDDRVRGETHVRSDNPEPPAGGAKGKT
jgi:hypothetical protein